jgi:hypothetical protein
MFNKFKKNNQAQIQNKEKAVADNQKEIVRCSADAARDFISVTTSDGQTFEGRKALRDVQVGWKRLFDPYLGWISVEDRIWFDEGRAERLYQERMIRKGVLDFAN